VATLARVSTKAAAPSEIDEEVAAVIVPSLAKAGLSEGILSGLPLPGASSVSTTVSPARLLTVTATISLGAAQRFDRVVVLVLAGQLVLVGGVLRESAHRPARLVSVFEAIEEHVIVGSVMPDPRARAVLLEQIGGVGHRLHSTRDDQIDRPGGECFGAHDHRLHARSANLVYGGRLNRGRQTRLDRRLTGRSLTKSGGEHAAHIDPLDIAAFNARALDRRLDRRRAEIGRRDVRERTLHRAHRRAGIGQDDDRIGRGKLGHDSGASLVNCTIAVAA
jgi:hypothetical protein